jgi:hypothetical protein
MPAVMAWHRVDPLIFGRYRLGECTHIPASAAVNLRPHVAPLLMRLAAPVLPILRRQYHVIHGAMTYHDTPK